jgi:Spy/CpxP family protein refolding chaperone
MAVALSLATAVAAQDKAKEKGKPARLSPTARAMLGIERLRTALEGLDLTEEQKEKLQKIREGVGPKMKEAFGKMRDILTEEQRNAAEESARKAKDAGKKGRDLMVAVESTLKLTDEQKEKMDKIGQDLLALQKDMMKEILGVLTTEQQAKIKEKMRPEGKRDRKPAEK